MFIIFCRLFQFFYNFYIMFFPWRKAIPVEGPGCISKIPVLLRENNVKKPMFVTDNGLVKAGITQRIIDVLVKAQFAYVVFTDIEPNPSVITVNNIQRLYIDQGCDGFIALGGGSSIDAAKAAAARAVRPKKSVSQLGGLFKVRKKLPVFIAVPTTAGTGSETTIAAFVTDTETHHKFVIMDLNLVPRYAILDTDLTVNLPPAITAAAGMDALTHAVEAYLCWTCNTRESIRLAIDAVKLILTNLEKVYDSPNNIPGRQAMLSASYKAGFASSRSGVGNVHVIAHTLGGLYNTPHGLANAVILPKVLEDYGIIVHEKLARLAEEAGLVSLSGAKTNAEKARIFIDTIYDMNKKIGIPKGFDYIKTEDIQKMADWAEKECNPLYPVPVIYNKERYKNIIESLIID